MADLASLSLGIDSTPLDALNQRLGQTAQAAPAAAAGLGTFAGGAASFTLNTAAAARSATAWTAAAVPATTATQALGAAAAATANTGMAAVGRQATAGAAAMNAVGAAATAAAHSPGLDDRLWGFLAFQARDFFDQVVNGGNVFRAAALQGTQAYGILSLAQGGVAAGVQSLIGGAARLATSWIGLGVIGGAAAAGAVLAWGSWKSAQEEVRISLIGVGQTMGVTIGDINKLSQTISTNKAMTVGNAREIALALAATGRISADAIEAIASQGKDFAKIWGVDNAQAAQLLAKAFANPAQGAEILNQRLGTISDKTQQYIQGLQNQNRLTESQLALAKAVQPEIQRGLQNVSSWSRAWDAAAAAASR
jgi:hypothetical protein